MNTELDADPDAGGDDDYGDGDYGDGDGGADLEELFDEAPLTRAQERRARRDVIEDGAPREGVAIIRRVEAAVIVGVQLPGRTSAEVEASLDELEALLETAGAEVVERIVQRRTTRDSATYIGRGKVEELATLVEELGADAVVFDEELAPAQQRNLEEAIKQKVLDRTIVILDIFAQHASSREGKAQVELAQLSYMLPRLRGWGVALSRQAGGRTAGGAGIGGRGPGETQLEVDRRRIMRRMSKLRVDLEEFDRIRRTKAQDRERNLVPTAALVGYTNAGKSSLLNALTGSDVLVENKLFATLDPTVRRLDIGDSRELVLTDTVGFVKKLPHKLVEAFKSTLEESKRADLLLHIVDASHPEAESHLVAVREVLEEIGADKVPEQLVLNKADLADPDTLQGLIRNATRDGASPVVVSAVTGEGIEQLTERIRSRLPGTRMKIDVTVPFDRQDLVAMAHRRGDVHTESYDTSGTHLIATVDIEVAQAMREFLDPDPFAPDPEAWRPEGEA